MKNEVRHPSYGMLGFYRVSGGNPKLFGSSVPHNEKIQMVLKEGSVSRDLNREWYFGGKTIVELEMSYNQFAEAIASMNMGNGVPVTLTYIRGEEKIPECDFELSGEQYKKEFSNQLKEANGDVLDLIENLKEMFNKPRLTKAEKEDVLSTLNKVSMAIGVNAEYMLSAFNDHMEQSVLDAKNEVEAFVQNKMHSLAMEKLKDDGVLDKIQNNMEKTQQEMNVIDVE